MCKGLLQRLTSWLRPRPLFPLVVGYKAILYDVGRDAYTTFEIVERRPFGCASEAFNLRISKTKREAYWAPEEPKNVDFFLALDSQGRVTSPGARSYNWEAQKWDSVGNTWTAYPATEPPTYLVVDPRAKAGVPVVSHTRYLFAPSGYEPPDGCIDSMYPGVVEWGPPPGRWTTTLSVEWVDTPAYHGSAYCFRYAEGHDPTAGETDAAAEHNAEVWCFAPGLGIVEVRNLHFQYMGIVYGVNRPPMVLKAQSIVAPGKKV